MPMTRLEAMSEAAKMGLEGIHRMDDGGFMPGGTHAAYEAAKDRNENKGLGVAQTAGGPDQKPNA